MFSLQGGNGPNRAPGVRAPGALAVGVGMSGSPQPLPCGLRKRGPERKREATGAALAAARLMEWTELLHRRGRLVHHGDAQSCRWRIGTPRSKGYATSLQGGPSPHTPAVARGHRATSPVRAETLFHLAFSGITASPPSALEQPKEGPLPFAVLGLRAA